MKHILYSLLIFFFITNCTLKKVLNHHGVNFLDKKQLKLTINNTNTNDIIKILGPPSTKSSFDEDLWIYIERTTSSSRLSKLGKKTLLKNNVLILEINSKGILAKKIFLDKESMNNVQFTRDITEMSLTKRTYIYDFLSTLRKKMNDPLGKRK